MPFSLSELLSNEFSQPHRRVCVRTADGVALRGVHLERAGSASLIVYAHGFMSHIRYRGVPRFIEQLSAHLDVMAVDFRGHGRSDGRATFGDPERLDLGAVVREGRRRGYRSVVVLGCSAGGATALRYAGHVAGRGPDAPGWVDGVVTIGAFSDARALRRRSTRVLLHFFYRVPLVGRLYPRLVGGTRLGELQLADGQPIDLVDRIAVPLLLIQGQWDPLVHPDEAKRLAARAGDHCRWVLIPRGGHVQPLLHAGTVRRVVDWIDDVVARRDG